MLILVGCPDGEQIIDPDQLPIPVDGLWSSPLLDESGMALTVEVLWLDEEETPLLQTAVEDLKQALLWTSGASETGERVGVYAVLSSTDPGLGDESYIIHRVGSGQTAYLEVSSGTQTGLAYGLYQVAQWLGVMYIHPEETAWSVRDELTLDWEESHFESAPRFSMRGFHEHTQHPTVWSDFLLKPGDASFREAVSNYLHWLARNRQNQLTFHMLKTVDLEAWVPYMKGIVEEAHSLSIDVGAVIGFVDQQQNAYKMIGELPELPEEKQLAQRVNAVLESGLDILGVQIGASEFVKPPDEDVPGLDSNADEPFEI